MKQKIILSVMFLALIFMSAVSCHSVQEIHYLKSFFPQDFTTEQAMHAGIIELAKIIIIAIPTFLLIILCLGLLKLRK